MGADTIDQGEGARKRALASGVRPAAGLLGLLYGLLAVFHQVGAPLEIRGPLSTMAALTAAIAISLFVVLGRRPLAPSLAPHTAGFLAALATGNSLVHLALSGDPLQSSNLMLVLVALGAIIDDDRWAGALAMTIVGGWVAVAALAAPSPMWAHFGYGLLSASILGALLRVARRRGQHSLELARAQAAALATNDALTGLLNRRGLEIVAEQALGVARRRHLPVVLLFCDRARTCMAGIGVSVGAAIATEAMRTSLEQLLDEADAQMYEEKRRKRDPAPGVASTA